MSIGAFKVKDLPKGCKRVSSRWVFNIKYTLTGLIDKFKARLMAKGFSQTYGSDYIDTFSPTIKLDSLRALLAIAAANNWPIQQMDIVSAYLARALDKEIYIEPPNSLRLLKGSTVQLIKALYSLKQSGCV
jgi:Reverse transcriptase (RNA-dependent DNA polymerase)